MFFSIDTHLVRVFIGLGSNLGHRRAQIKKALAWLATQPAIELVRVTQLKETEPWGVSNQPRFVNAIAEIHTGLSPHNLLGELKTAEKEIGRRETSRKWGPREIDIDILLYGDLVIETKDLRIPHEHLASRPFVVEQILDLDPDLIHPKLGVPIRSFL